ncbi:MAG: hypothetical protein Edafosvirus1_85 [Edafosvirus sp.]|uniref:Uncharacterized protein n=1 Tax=Edafosvirus sp. TaxID=2487765 RepID=A0A3G4ZTV6_9VIRU|nr:MAG: hypothetical protein Edafosvirus1_85 [Edafosvirus sp.]
MADKRLGLDYSTLLSFMSSNNEEEKQQKIKECIDRNDKIVQNLVARSHEFKNVFVFCESISHIIYVQFVGTLYGMMVCGVPGGDAYAEIQLLKYEREIEANIDDVSNRFDCVKNTEMGYEGTCQFSDIDELVTKINQVQRQASKTIEIELLPLKCR